MAKAHHTPEHRAEVAAILRDYPGAQATGFPQAVRALRKRLGFDDGTGDTDDECAMRINFVPDAFRLNEAECEIEIYEVEVTHHVPAVKWHRLGYFWSEWDAEDEHDWLPVLVLVDRRGRHMRVDLCNAYHDLLSKNRPDDARLKAEAEV